MRIKIFGIYIQITFWFTAFLSAMLLIDKTGYILPIFCAILSHELGHLITMKVLKCAPKEIILKPASFEIIGFVPKTNLQCVAISAFGSATNLLLFLLLYFIYKITNSYLTLIYAAAMLCVGFINLLPSKGLDGGDLLYNLLCLFLNKDKSMFILKFVSLITAFAVVFFAISGVIFKNISLPALIFGIYLFICTIFTKGEV